MTIPDIELGPDGEYYIKITVRKKATRREIDRWVWDSKRNEARPLEARAPLPTLSMSLTNLKRNSLYKEGVAIEHGGKGTDDDSDIDTEDPPRNANRPRYISTRKYPPFFIIFVSCFQIVAFFYYASLTEQPITENEPMPVRSNLVYDPQRRYEVWRYLTYMLIHGGWLHITCNLVIQLFVGIPLEMMHGFESVFFIYMGGVIGGALGSSIIDPNSILAGASSGTYALVAANISNLVINWTEIKYACGKFFALLSFIAYDFCRALYLRLNAHPSSLKISASGHFAGFASGLLLGLLLLKNVRVIQWERRLKQWACLVYCALVIYAILFNIFNPEHFPLPRTEPLNWSGNPFATLRVL